MKVTRPYQGNVEGGENAVWKRRENGRQQNKMEIG
jgi:hypothetical protein